MRFADRLRPASLAQIVGQPAAARLAQFAAKPYRSCWLLEGPSGTGKTASAVALASDLKATEWSVYLRKAARLGIEEAVDLFDRTTRYRPMQGRWHVVILEEFERCVSDAVKDYLKTALDADTPSEDGGLSPSTVVVATSNDITKIDPILLQRFAVLRYNDGSIFRDAAVARILEVFRSTFPWAVPPCNDTIAEWGLWESSPNVKRWSFRQCVSRFQTWIRAEKLEEAEDAQ
jgi:hypothetical protein